MLDARTQGKERVSARTRAGRVRKKTNQAILLEEGTSKLGGIISVAFGV